MRIFLDLWRYFFSRKSEMSLPTENPLLVDAKSVLADGGVAADQLVQPRRYAISRDNRYCAMTLENYESYVVDTEQRRYAHYPTAGVDGFCGATLILSPDEMRFSLDTTGYDTLEIDLLSDDVLWLRDIKDIVPGDNGAVQSSAGSRNDVCPAIPADS